MKITNLLKDVRKFKETNQQLALTKTNLESQIANLTKTTELDYQELSQKLSRFKQIAAVRLIKEAFLNQQKINLTYELAKAENAVINLEEDKQHLKQTQANLEDQINDLETELNNTTVNQEEFAQKLLDLNNYLARPTSLAEKLTIPASDWNTLNDTLTNIRKLSQANLLALQEKEDKVSELIAGKEQLNGEKTNLQNDLEVQIKLLEDEVAKAKLTTEEEEILDLIRKLKFTDQTTIENEKKHLWTTKNQSLK